MIPPGWTKSKVRYLARYINGAAFKPDDWSDAGTPIIRIQNLTDPSADFNYYDGTLREKYRVREGDILLPWSASPGIHLWNRTGEAWLNQHIFKVKPYDAIIAKRYFYWLAAWFIPEMERMLHGSTMQHFTWNAFASFDVPLPPKHDQTQIADFLDRETAKTDALVAKYERLIELLEEKRVALITQAVTKGLTPNVPMEDSGVEWIGKIPAHWDCAPLRRHLARPLQYGATESGEPDLTGAPRYIRITDIEQNGTLRDEDIRYLPKGIAAPYLLHDGDILLARSGATVGKAFLYRESMGQCCFAGYMIRLRLDGLVLPSFLQYFTASKAYWAQIRRSALQATIENVSASLYAALRLPIPPISEQRTIIDMLDGKTAYIENLQRYAIKAIELLREHRSVLITAAVTGQIDVRTYKPKSDAVEVPT